MHNRKNDKKLLSWNNTYLDTSLEMAPKSDEPWYCIKDVATPKDLNLNYQPGVHTNLEMIVLYTQ